MTLGIVYCAICESYPGRCKIGKTFRNAAQRIAELQRHYRSQHPFTPYDSKLVDHYSRVEWLVHKRLAHCREVATEMFVCTPAEAMAAIAWATEEALRNPPDYQPRLERAPKRWRKARRPFPTTLLATVATAGLLAGVVILKPGLPTWLPEPVAYTLLLAERLR